MKSQWKLFEPKYFRCLQADDWRILSAADDKMIKVWDLGNADTNLIKWNNFLFRHWSEITNSQVSHGRSDLSAVQWFLHRVRQDKLQNINQYWGIMFQAATIKLLSSGTSPSVDFSSPSLWLVIFSRNYAFKIHKILNFFNLLEYYTYIEEYLELKDKKLLF